MKRKPSGLEDHLGYWLRRLSNQVSASFAERLLAFDISVPQWVVLRVLYDHEALSLKEMVERVGVDQGALSRMVDRLLVRRLVERKIDAGDRRAVSISLSEKGRKLVPDLAAAADQNDREFFRALPKAQQESFLAMVRKLLKSNKNRGGQQKMALD